MLACRGTMVLAILACMFYGVAGLPAAPCAGRSTKLANGAWCASMLSHCISWSSVNSLLQRGKFLRDVCRNTLRAEEVYAIAVGKDDGGGVDALFEYAKFLQTEQRLLHSFVPDAEMEALLRFFCS